jgi:hypothetical protein
MGPETGTNTANRTLALFPEICERPPSPHPPWDRPHGAIGDQRSSPGLGAGALY